MYFPMKRVYTDSECCWCANWPLKWPLWVGGNESFLGQGQPFHKVIELQQSTRYEF